MPPGYVAVRHYAQGTDPSGILWDRCSCTLRLNSEVVTPSHRSHARNPRVETLGKMAVSRFPFFSNKCST